MQECISTENLTLYSRENVRKDGKNNLDLERTSSRHLAGITVRRDEMDRFQNYECDGQMNLFEYQHNQEKLKGMNQCERIVFYIKTYGSISTMEAFNELGITRLASRIHDLVSDGYPVEKQLVKAKNRFGEPIHYTRYSLKEECHERFEQSGCHVGERVEKQSTPRIWNQNGNHQSQWNPMSSGSW